MININPNALEAAATALETEARKGITDALTLLEVAIKAYLNHKDPVFKKVWDLALHDEWEESIFTYGVQRTMRVRLIGGKPLNKDVVNLTVVDMSGREYTIALYSENIREVLS
jgi:hypothetical protein